MRAITAARSAAGVASPAASRRRRPGGLWSAAQARASCQCGLVTARRGIASSSGSGAATSTSRLQRPGRSESEVLLLGVGAAPQPEEFEAEVAALLRDAAAHVGGTAHVVLELPPLQEGEAVGDSEADPTLLLREVDQIIEQVVRKATFGFGSVPDGAGMRSYAGLFWALGLTPQAEMAAAREAARGLGLPLVRADSPMNGTLGLLRDALSFSELQSMLEAAATPQGQELQQLNRSLAAALPTATGSNHSESDAFLKMARPLQERAAVTALISALGEVAPAMKRVVIDARGAVMGTRLLELEGPTIAAVGLAQMDGIEKLFEEAGGRVERD